MTLGAWWDTASFMMIVQFHRVQIRKEYDWLDMIGAFLGRERRPDMHNSFAKLDAMTPV